MIRRSVKKAKFTTVDNSIVQTGFLSWQARGLLLTVLSKPDHWEIMPKALVNETKGSAKHTAINGVYAILKELRDVGFVDMLRLASGEVEYTVYDTPEENPNHHNPNEANPNEANPNEANDDAIVKTDKAVNTDLKAIPDTEGQQATGNLTVIPPVAVKVKIPYQAIVKMYHEQLPELPSVAKLTDTRKRYIKNLYMDDLPNRQAWHDFFEYVKQSDFLMGRLEQHGDRKPFVASLEWITKPANFVKILEENYHG